MTFVCFVRHGETDWNVQGKVQGRTDIPLNEAGVQQAKLAAGHLKDGAWDVVVSSPLKRAKRTAEIIGEAIDAHGIAEMNEFVERDNGETAGMKIAEVQTLFPDRNIIPGRESDKDLQERGLKGLQLLLQQYPGKRVLVVAHGGIINAILAAVSKGEIGTGKTRLDNTGLSRLAYQGNEWIIQEVNVIDHLVVR